MRLDKDDRNTVRIDFSNDLDPEQDLNGLATIEGISGIRYKISKNTLFLNTGRAVRINSLSPARLFSCRKKFIFCWNTLIIWMSTAFRATAEKGSSTSPFAGIMIPLPMNFTAGMSEGRGRICVSSSLSVWPSTLRMPWWRVIWPVFRKKIDLTENASQINLNRWHDFTVDLSKLVQLEKGVIYRVEIRFRKSYTTLDCANEGNDDANFYKQDWDGENDYYSSYYTPSDYRWEERNDPCSNSYYTSQRFISKNTLSHALSLSLLAWIMKPFVPGSR